MDVVIKGLTPGNYNCNISLIIFIVTIVGAYDGTC